MAVDLTAARRQLHEALGDFSQTYWNNMKLWYKQKISKEEFDTQAKKCLSNDTLHFHNEFLLAILAKCQALGATPASHPRTPQKLPPKPQLIKKGKIKKAKKVLKANFEQRFSPCDPLCDAPELSLKELSEDSEFGLCTYDMMLPDTATIYGRLFLGAWDAGLDNVDGHFRYAMGGTYPRMHLRNSSSPWPPNGEKYGTIQHFLSLLRVHVMLASFLSTAVAFVGTARRQLGKKNGGKAVENSQSQQHNFENWKTKLCYFIEPLFSLFSSRPYLFIKFEKLFLIYSNRFVSSNNTGRTLEQAEAEAAVHRRVIPSHTVYSANIERTLANMSHPGHDELEQNQLHKLETRRRYERLKQQRSLRL
ncbi:Transcriptional adapter 1 [Acropora cervicornis]|uniref:Transcriptional adapter 1 n=1 Tax=Acropora cervicornis TaxID=6130 RepID=A0AAD9V9M3_ACRCE|nr:Transcriptional adapter 1 [Acropora cervicornis]